MFQNVDDPVFFFGWLDNKINKIIKEITNVRRKKKVTKVSSTQGRTGYQKSSLHHMTDLHWNQSGGISGTVPSEALPRGERASTSRTYQRPPFSPSEPVHPHLKPGPVSTRITSTTELRASGKAGECPCLW